MLKIETGSKFKMASAAFLNFVLGHNFGVSQHFCTKFGTVMENWQPKKSHCSEIRFSKIQDGERQPS